MYLSTSQKVLICSLYSLMSPDIDECQDGHGRCNQTCTNIIGSYICSCNSGYVLAQDGHNCNGKHMQSGTICVVYSISFPISPDIDECLDGSYSCDVNAHCINVIGSYMCFCNGGYQGDGIIGSCTGRHDLEGEKGIHCVASSSLCTCTCGCRH